MFADGKGLSCCAIGIDRCSLQVAISRIETSKEMLDRPRHSKNQRVQSDRICFERNVP